MPQIPADPLGALADRVAELQHAGDRRQHLRVRSGGDQFGEPHLAGTEITVSGGGES
jgi:hypothetical protein